MYPHPYRMRARCNNLLTNYKKEFFFEVSASASYLDDLINNVFSIYNLLIGSGAEEERPINDLNWVAFNGDGTEDISVTPAENDGTYKEYKYSASNLNTFTTFQVKIVMKGTNSSYPPIIRDLRGIALAV